MRKTVTALAASAMLVALVIALLLWSSESRIVPVRSNVAEAPSTVGAAPPPGEPSLFCVFTNFADRSPLVGFYFLVEGERGVPVYVLAFQREQDGSQVNFGGEDKPSPEWAFDGGDDPAVIRAPEDDMQINLYSYDPDRRGTHWFEAGLRSVRYKNLGGRCRLSA